ncbi:hypothetical protein AB0903_14685 [Streptomyces sp. NPDC048389]|uniref:hypothetical protein n=1 Tax=Streptomyces sp. NPDC048389 TaxID=3154622 RepID=UPI0034538DA6
MDAALAGAVALFVTGLALHTVKVTADLVLCGLLMLTTGLSAVEAWRHELLIGGVQRASAPRHFLGIPVRHLARVNWVLFGAWAGGGYGLAAVPGSRVPPSRRGLPVTVPAPEYQKIRAAARERRVHTQFTRCGVPSKSRWRSVPAVKNLCSTC